MLKGAIIGGGTTAGGDLAASLPSGLTVRMATGCAMIKGFAYENDSVVDFTMSSRDATQDRYERIVLRLSFSGKTIALTRLTGTLGGAVPAITQDATTWDVLLYQIKVTHNANPTAALTAGEVTDERVYAGGIAPTLQGAGSTLDADKLDGHTSAEFVMGTGVAGGNQHIIVLDRQPVDSDGVNGDLVLWY